MTMMFFDRAADTDQHAANDYFNDVDLSEQLDHRRAILVGRVGASGSKLMLDKSEVTENVNSATFLRVVLPVTPGPDEPQRFDQ